MLATRNKTLIPRYKFLSKTKLDRTALATTALVTFTITVWASAFPAIKIALVDYNPAQLATLRYMVASLVLFFLLRGQISRLPNWQDALRFVVCGITGISVYNIAVAYGEMTVPAGVASLLVSTSPLFAAFLAHLVLKERLNLRSWIGLFVSLSGAVLIATSHGGMSSFDRGSAAILLAAALQGLSIVLQKPLFGKYSAAEVTAYTVWGATLSMVFFLPSVAGALLKASLGNTLAVLYLGAVPAALGLLAWGYILARLKAARAASLLYLVPVAALVVSWLWLGEVPALVSVWGGALSVGGIAIAARSKQKQAENAQPGAKIVVLPVRNLLAGEFDPSLLDSVAVRLTHPGHEHLQLIKAQDKAGGEVDDCPQCTRYGDKQECG